MNDIFQQVGRKVSNGTEVVIIRWENSGIVQTVPAADFRQFECDNTQWFPAFPADDAGDDSCPVCHSDWKRPHADDCSRG